MSGPRHIAGGAIFEITELDGIVRCVMTNRPDVTAEEGARCAQQIQQACARVLTQKTSYKGLVFDVRNGPAVFGPKTRAQLEELFRLAERNRVPIAVQVGEAAIQRLQFSSLCRDCAPTVAAVVDDVSGWVGSHAAN